MAHGFIGVLPIIGVSAVIWIVLTITGTLTGIKQNIPLLYEAFYTFFVLAFAEELVKFLAFRGLIKKKLYSYSWADLVAFIGVSMALLDLVALVLMFRFFIKARKKEKYNQPLVLAEEGAGVEVTENK